MKKEQTKKDWMAHYPSPEEILSDYLREIGRKGGKVKSKVKRKASLSSLKKARTKRWK